MCKLESEYNLAFGMRVFVCMNVCIFVVSTLGGGLILMKFNEGQAKLTKQVQCFIYVQN